MKLNTRYLIETENGFKEFLGIQKTSKQSGFKINFLDCCLICSKAHKIKIGNEFISVENLKVNQMVNGKEILNIAKITEVFYDIIAVQGNSYTSEGFEHHNCNVLVVDETAYVKTNLWNSFIDSIAPSQSALAWKKNIFLSTANGVNHFKTMCEQAQKPKRYFDLPDNTQIQLSNGKLISIKEFEKSQR